MTTNDRDILAGLDQRAAAGDVLCAAAAAAIRSRLKVGRPVKDDERALREMESLLAEGKVRTIGRAAMDVALTLVNEHSHESAAARLARKFGAERKVIFRDNGAIAILNTCCVVGEQQ